MVDYFSPLQIQTHLDAFKLVIKHSKFRYYHWPLGTQDGCGSGPDVSQAPADLIQQCVQHADAEDAAGGEGQAEHEGQVGAVLTLPLQDRAAQTGWCPQPQLHGAGSPGRACTRVG